MSYLLDTCILSKSRKKDEESLILRAWIARHDMASYFISVLTIGEIQFGIPKLRNESEKIKNALQSWLLGEVVPNFDGRILPIDQQICSIWGTMTAKASHKGITLPMSDALLAATAIKHNLIVVTLNIKHFTATGVRLFNPLA